MNYQIVQQIAIVIWSAQQFTPDNTCKERSTDEAGSIPVTAKIM